MTDIDQALEAMNVIAEGINSTPNLHFPHHELWEAINTVRKALEQHRVPGNILDVAQDTRYSNDFLGMVVRQWITAEQWNKAGPEKNG